MTSRKDTANGMGSGMGMGMGRGMGMGMGNGMGMGMGNGMGMGMGNGMGMGMGNGMGMGMGNGMGMGMGNGMGMGMGNGMGMGMGNGMGMGAIPVGADGGIGFIRSYYATPIELALLPWSLNFTPDNSGETPFPLEFIINPYQPNSDPLEWTTADWDPDLRFWTLPFDPQLGEWLRAADRSEPGTLAALEIAGQFGKWLPISPGRIPPGIDPIKLRWLEANDLKWQPGDTAAENLAAFLFVKGELEKLKIYMEDDRWNYLVESDVQADGLPDYLIHFLGINSFDHPNTLDLINVGLAIGNVIYMAYKAYYKRVRPSILRPGLTVPFGPPAHPAFPSGHSFLAHFISLLLLEIPGIYYRYGVLKDKVSIDGADIVPSPEDGHLLRKPRWSDLRGTAPIKSPLLAIAHRIAVNRERIGVHYPTDSTASRHLAAGIWDALFDRANDTDVDGNPIAGIDCPTLMTVLDASKVEWPTPWDSDPVAEVI